MQRLEVSGAVRPLYGSLGVKGLKCVAFQLLAQEILGLILSLFSSDARTEA
jgi:hypothetical protein